MNNFEFHIPTKVVFGKILTSVQASLSENRAVKRCWYITEEKVQKKAVFWTVFSDR